MYVGIYILGQKNLTFFLSSKNSLNSSHITKITIKVIKSPQVCFD